MVLESITSIMETSTRECGEKIKDMGKASIITRMEKSIEECTDRVSVKVMEHSTIGMEIDTKESGRMAI